MPARNVDGAWNVAFVPLALLSHVDDEWFAALDQLPRLGRVDLVDLGPDLLQELSIGWHRYRKYSFAPLASVVAR